MELSTTRQHLRSNSIAESLFDFLSANEVEFGLQAAIFYFDFPVYRSDEGELLTCSVLIASPEHGVVAIATASAAGGHTEAVRGATDALSQILPYMFSRFIRQSSLRKSKTNLLFPVEGFVYLTSDQLNLRPADSEIPVFSSPARLQTFFKEQRCPTIEQTTFTDIISTIEGAKGLIRPKGRNTAGLPQSSKGVIVTRLEQEIANFDQRQRHGNVINLEGPQRIRGLAGSGKTVVLAMKAAQIHLREPNATVVYTFYTKSLYQHIQRLITRFYRQFDDRDPDWDRIRIMHAWGGKDNPGVYSEACLLNNVRPQTFGDVSQAHPGKEFEAVCDNLLKRVDISAVFDYVLVDEGQDFPLSFLRLCGLLAKGRKFVFAYDELQTIFQTTVPTANDIFGEEQSNTAATYPDDIVLYKCYRNPREILVCAHALGFGIYGRSIVQMLENKDHWEDIGYKVLSGNFRTGSEITVERPEANSLRTISESGTVTDIIAGRVFKDLDSEVDQLCHDIKTNIEDGLLPEDILVVSLDDRNAKSYFAIISSGLAQLGIQCNNIHLDSFGLRDFQIPGHVTLSTVYKAKGNEAYLVYVVGVDAVFAPPSVRQRNKLFTAITRAKGWARISGIGVAAEACIDELRKAQTNFPCLKFIYPSSEQLKVMKRDLRKSAIERQEMERQLELIIDNMGQEEIMKYLQRKAGNAVKESKRLSNR